MNEDSQDDFCALEADCLLTAIIYNRTSASKIKKNKLMERVQFLKTIK